MAIKILTDVSFKDNARYFNSHIDDLSRAENWEFKYTALNENGQDIVRFGGRYDYRPESYPAGTVFLGSNTVDANILSSIENVVYDNTPPKIVSTDFTSTVFTQYEEAVFKGKIVIESDSLIDLCKFNIKYNTVSLTIDLITAERFDNNTGITVDGVSDFFVNRNGDTYTLTFKLDIEKFRKTTGKFTMEFFDICGNSTGEYVTDEYTWTIIDEKLTRETISPLIITFIDIYPKDRIILDNIVGEVTVQVYNPNKSLWPFRPHVELGQNSIGAIDMRTFGPESYDETTGTLTFKVKDVTRHGSLIVDAWIDFTTVNPELAPLIKTLTFAEAILKDFIVQEKGRLYKFKPYIPNYLKDERYGEFVMFFEKFLNTSQRSLTTGNAISTLEKIARIGDFNDITKIEIPMLQYYRAQYNCEVSPNLNSLLQYLNSKEDIQHDKSNGTQD